MLRSFALCCIGILSLAASGCAYTTIGPATDLTNRSAVLHGGVGSLERTTGRYEFEWGKTTAYGDQHWPPHYVRFLPDSEVADVSFPVGFLEPGTTYHYRLCAENDGAAERFCSRDRQFVTPAAAPGAPKVYLTERCGIDGSPGDYPQYAVMALEVGLPQGKRLTTLQEVDGQVGGAIGPYTVGPDGHGDWGGFGLARWSGAAKVTVFEDLDNDHFEIDPGETVHAQGTIENICAGFPQEP